MKQETLKHLADGATISAVSTGIANKLGWFHFINENAAGIGVLLTAFFGIVGLVFYYLTWKKSTLSDENKQKIEFLGEAFDDHKEETKKQFECVHDGLSCILAKLDKND